MSKWQLPSTAPKSGKRFIAWDPRAGMLFTMHWNRELDQFMTDYERWSGVFTHWMPLPKPPK